MPIYRCLIEGENFLLDFGDGPERMGFVTTRWIRAASPDDAERQCLAKLKAQGELGTKHPDDTTGLAKVYFREIVELPKRRFARFGKGFGFFPMGEADDTL
ncbi:hypothetical protein ACFFUB_05450 [Algimonas porphyrae]|uniref:Uncharacterized protein n=1 Tax=Algimonas porphyrae TaxID=1128113 RepID=A0ABQ5V2R6_9PROT|nr:hypothetical protein [Algimonas porphyrae]GLQ21813.1 hypothetical protein GCM10007854_27680 [Algimonas porphyrae]